MQNIEKRACKELGNRLLVYSLEDRWNHNRRQIKTSRNTLTHTLLKQTTKKLDCISSKILYFDLVTELQDATKAKSMAMSGIKSKHQEMVFCF